MIFSEGNDKPKSRTETKPRLDCTKLDRAPRRSRRPLPHATDDRPVDLCRCRRSTRSFYYRFLFRKGDF